VIGPKQGGTAVLGRGHRPLCQQRPAPLGQFGDVPAAGALAQQLLQGRGQAATAAVGRQMQGQGPLLRLEQPFQKDRFWQTERDWRNDDWVWKTGRV
jgi:hypothetical protein